MFFCWHSAIVWRNMDRCGTATTCQWPHWRDGGTAHVLIKKAFLGLLPREQLEGLPFFEDCKVIHVELPCFPFSCLFHGKKDPVFGCLDPQHAFKRYAFHLTTSSRCVSFGDFAVEIKDFFWRAVWMPRPSVGLTFSPIRITPANSRAAISPTTRWNMHAESVCSSTPFSAKIPAWKLSNPVQNPSRMSTLKRDWLYRSRKYISQSLVFRGHSLVFRGCKKAILLLHFVRGIWKISVGINVPNRKNNKLTFFVGNLDTWMS